MSEQINSVPTVKSRLGAFLVFMFFGGAGVLWLAYIVWNAAFAAPVVPECSDEIARNQLDEIIRNQSPQLAAARIMQEQIVTMAKGDRSRQCQTRLTVTFKDDVSFSEAIAYETRLTDDNQHLLVEVTGGTIYHASDVVIAERATENPTPENIVALVKSQGEIQKQAIDNAVEAGKAVANYVEAEQAKKREPSELTKVEDLRQAVPETKQLRTASVNDAASPIEASFNCAKASTAIELLICSSQAAADADKQMAAAYHAARAKSSDPKKLKADQLFWIKNSRNACTDAACLLEVSDSRTKYLASL